MVFPLRLAVREPNSALDAAGAPIESAPHDPGAGAKCGAQHEELERCEHDRCALHEDEFERLHRVVPRLARVRVEGGVAWTPPDHSQWTADASSALPIPGQPDIEDGLNRAIFPADFTFLPEFIAKLVGSFFRLVVRADPLDTSARNRHQFVRF